MLFKVKYKSATGDNPEIQEVYAVRFEEKEGSAEGQGETYFLFFDGFNWSWDQAYKFEPVE